MKSYTLTVLTPSEQAVLRLDQQLRQKLTPLLHKTTLERTAVPGGAQWLLVPSATAWVKAERKQLVDGLAEALAEHIVREEEEPLLNRLIGKQYGYDDEEEIAAILRYCRQLFDKQESHEDTGLSEPCKREQLIARQIRAYLAENSLFHTQGFVRFRLRDYMEELCDVVEYAIDEYLMDRQYQEFISLLKYFVFIQDTKIPAAHLMHKGGHEFVLLNEQMVPIDTTELESTFTVELLDKEINFEDLIVSTPITVAPENIYIHTRDPEMQVIKTILQIFEQRAKICDYCRYCKPILGERSKQDQLYP